MKAVGKRKKPLKFERHLPTLLLHIELYQSQGLHDAVTLAS
jgi:hypothetical protein